MKERPILFNGDMVRAILDGRKTQTRRVTLRGEGFDASEDGTGRGTPIVVCRDVAPSLTSSYAKQPDNSDTSMGPNVVAALAICGRNGVSQVEMRKDGLANTVLTPSGGRAGMGVGAVLYRAGVRRLTPTECERLQGLPDGHTLIPWRNKSEEQCPDGPRYRACGNAMPRNVMAWLGERIERVLGGQREHSSGLRVRKNREGV